jgi:hypothetical protein
MLTSEVKKHGGWLWIWRIKKNNRPVAASWESYLSARSAKRALDRFVENMSLNLNKNLDGSGIEYQGVVK